MAEYPNRTDLQNKAQKVAKAAAKGQTYGAAGEQLAAQSMVPMASGDVTTPPVAAAAPQQQAPRAVPGMRGDFYRPTEAPMEPITAGMNMGPGINSLQAGIPQAFTESDVVLNMRALYAAFPSDDLAELIDFAANGVF